jgi:ElaB/YqjD/DUF883 family membrane-anchored ribosome-binding protein
MSDAATPTNGATAASRTRKPAASAKPRAESRSFAPETVADAAADLARARREAMRAWADARAETAARAVKSRPNTAIAAALGIGVIIGLLSRR